jgi:hypothetical protein
VPEFIALVVPEVPAAPIELLEPVVPAPVPAPAPVLPDMPPALPRVVPLLPETEPDVPAPAPPLLEPRVLPEPARSSAPLPVELDDPMVVPVPLPVPPDVPPPVAPALPRVEVLPPDAPRAEVLLPAPDAHGIVEPGLMADPGLVEVEPDEDWAVAKPAAAANAETVTSIAIFLLLAIMFETPCAVERMGCVALQAASRPADLCGAGRLTPLVSH